jgi:hypothetical protein
VATCGGAGFPVVALRWAYAHVGGGRNPLGFQHGMPVQCVITVQHERPESPERAPVDA